jgi:hypothetical protein
LASELAGKFLRPGGVAGYRLAATVNVATFWKRSRYIIKLGVTQIQNYVDGGLMV